MVKFTESMAVALFVLVLCVHCRSVTMAFKMHSVNVAFERRWISTRSKGHHILRKDTQLQAVVSKKGPSSASNLPDLSQRSFPDIPADGYDIVVLGSGPGGESTAVRSAQLGARVAVVEKRSTFGGPTGLTSKAVREAAKRICKAVDQVGGDRRRQVKGLWKRRFPVLKTEAEVLQAAETRDKLRLNNIDLFVGEAELIDPSPTSPSSQASSSVSNVVRVKRGNTLVDIPTKHICIATGSRSNKPDKLPNGVPLLFTKDKIVDATDMGNLQTLPDAIAIIGGGVIAVEYATVLAELGVGVSLICADQDFMPFLDRDLRNAMRKRMIEDRVLFVSEEIEDIEIESDDAADSSSAAPARRAVRKGVKVTLKADPNRPSAVQRRLKVDLVLYSGGRNANSEGLGLEKYGVPIGKYGRIDVDKNNRKAVSTKPGSSVFAVGDVTGPPGLASSAMQQGRAVAQTLFEGLKRPIQSRLERELAAEVSESTQEEEGDKTGGNTADKNGGGSAITATTTTSTAAATIAGTCLVSEQPTLFGSAVGATAPDAPMTIWTIPEMASVGTTLAEAESRGAVPISEPGGTLVEGVAYFKDMARGRLSGDLDGFLKIIAAQISEDNNRKHRIIGVQIFGDGANELIQLGSILVHGGATVEQVSQTPFAAVTLSGLFQMASDDCLMKTDCATAADYE